MFFSKHINLRSFKTSNIVGEITYHFKLIEIIFKGNLAIPGLQAILNILNLKSMKH